METSSRGVDRRRSDEEIYSSTGADPGHRCSGSHWTNGVPGQTHNALRIGRVVTQGSLEYAAVR